MPSSPPWARIRLGSDGSFVLGGAPGDDGRLIRVAFGASGVLSVLSLPPEGGWYEATVRLGRAVDRRRDLLRLRVARAVDEGVEAAETAYAATGGRRTREMFMDGLESCRWSIVDVRADGSRITGDGRLEEGTASVTRRWDDADGQRLRETASTCARKSGRTGTRIASRSETVYPHGGISVSERVSTVASDGERRFRRRTAWADMPEGSVVERIRETVTAADGTRRTGSVVQTFGDGSRTIRHIDELLQPGGRRIRDVSVTRLLADGAGRSVFQGRQESVVHGGSGGAAGRFRPTAGSAAGGSLVDEGWGVDARGNTVVVTVENRPDGTVAITTVNRGPDGHGNRRVTVRDAAGHIVSDTTEPAEAEDAEPTAAEQLEDDRSDEDSEDWAGAYDFDVPEPARGGREDGWQDREGGGEEPPDMLPNHARSVFALMSDPEAWYPEDEESAPIARRLEFALRDRVPYLGGAGPDTGWGEGGGEAPPDVELGEADLASLRPVYGPTGDWDDWKDPRVHTGYVRALLSALAHTTAVDPAAVSQAVLAYEALSTRIDNVLLRHES
ncbi:hypothetical protein ACWDV7_13535 [Streptomyces sp. NPDC003362]